MNFRNGEIARVSICEVRHFTYGSRWSNKNEIYPPNPQHPQPYADASLPASSAEDLARRVMILAALFTLYIMYTARSLACFPFVTNQRQANDDSNFCPKYARTRTSVPDVHCYHLQLPHNLGLEKRADKGSIFLSYFGPGYSFSRILTIRFSATAVDSATIDRAV